MPHPFKKYTQREVHDSVIKKLPGKKSQKRTGDPIWILDLKGKSQVTFRFPNPHARVPCWPKESKRIAETLKLRPEEYNRFIDCSLGGGKLLRLLEERFGGYENKE